MKLEKNINLKKQMVNNFKANLELEVFARTKKAISIIYQFHKKKKRILIAGLPLKLFYYYKKLKKINKFKHLLLPENFWINGLLTNKHSCFFSQKKKQNKNSKFLLQFFKKTDLIILIGKDDNLQIYKEGVKKSIPFIFFNSDVNIYNMKYVHSCDTALGLNKVKSQAFQFLTTILSNKSRTKNNKTRNCKYVNKNFYIKKKRRFLNYKKK